MINKTSSPGTVQLNISVSHGTGSIALLQPPSLPAASALLSTNGITLGGQTYDGTTDGTMVGTPVATPLLPSGSSYFVNLPAYSAALVTFSN